MTREKVKERIFLHSDIMARTMVVPNEVDTVFLLRRDILKEVDRIYDDFEIQLNNAERRYEMQCDKIKDCSEFSTKQALEINKLKNKIIKHETTMRVNGIML